MRRFGKSKALTCAHFVYMHSTCADLNLCLPLLHSYALKTVTDLSEWTGRRSCWVGIISRISVSLFSRLSVNGYTVWWRNGVMTTNQYLQEPRFKMSVLEVGEKGWFLFYI